MRAMVRVQEFYFSESTVTLINLFLLVTFRRWHLSMYFGSDRTYFYYPLFYQPFVMTEFDPFSS
jgi:hypothetical protein